MGGGPGGIVFNEFLLELTTRKDDFIRLFLGGGVWGEWLETFPDLERKQTLDMMTNVVDVNTVCACSGAT